MNAGVKWSAISMVGLTIEELPGPIGELSRRASALERHMEKKEVSKTQEGTEEATGWRYYPDLPNKYEPVLISVADPMEGREDVVLCAEIVNWSEGREIIVDKFASLPEHSCSWSPKEIIAWMEPPPVARRRNNR